MSVNVVIFMTHHCNNVRKALIPEGTTTDTKVCNTIMCVRICNQYNVIIA